MDEAITETLHRLEGDTITVVKVIRRAPPEHEYERRLAELMQKPKDAWTDQDTKDAEFLIEVLRL